ncbi:MAG: lysophospholipase [Bacteroidota bacterium]
MSLPPPLSASASLPPPSHYGGTFQGASGTSRFEQVWLPPCCRGVVVLVHGYAEHIGRYQRLAHDLNRLDLAVHGYDQEGYGRSEGERAYMDELDPYVVDLELFVRRVQQQHPHLPCFVLGHSMGGLMAGLWATSYQPAVQGLILSSPALIVKAPAALKSVANVVSLLMPRLPTPPLTRDLISRDPQVLLDAQRDPLNYHGATLARTGAVILEAARTLRDRLGQLNAPLLVFHGTADGIADPQSSHLIYDQAASADKTLHLFEGFYHETFNEPAADRQQVLDLLSTWIEARLPSEARAATGA